MNRKRVLLISPFFYPEKISTGKWNTYVAKAIAEDHDLDVVCLHPTYPQWKVNRSDAQLTNIRIFRRGAYLLFPKSPLLRRLILELYFAFTVFNFLLLRRRKYEEVIYVFPPSLMAGICNLIFKQRKVGIVHDLQGVYASNSTSLLGGFLSKGISFVEKYAFSGCDKLIFLSREMRDEALSNYGIEAGGTSVAYPFVTIEKYKDNGRLNHLIDINKVNLVYAGAMGKKQKPQELVDFMFKAVNHFPKLEAHVFSQGIEFDIAKDRYEGICSSLKFHDLVSEGDLPELMLKADIQIVAQAEGTSSGSLPSKLPNILAACRKVFVITDPGSELSHLLNEIKGVSCNFDWETSRLIESLEVLMNEGCHEEGSRSKILELLTIDHLKEALLADHE